MTDFQKSKQGKLYKIIDRRMKIMMVVVGIIYTTIFVIYPLVRIVLN